MENNGQLDVATGASAKSKTWRNTRIFWADLVKRLSDPVRTAESVREWNAASKEDKSRIKDVGGYVGGYLRGGRRKPENVAHRQLLTLDVDFAEPFFAEDFEFMFNCAAVLHSSHSHTAEAPRLRLLIPLSREVTAEEYTAIGKGVATELGIDQFDPSTFEPNRLMYWPSCSKGAEYVFRTIDRPWLDADAQLARSPEASATPRAHRERLAAEAARQEDPELKKGIVGAFCRTYPISAAVEMFLSDTYTPCGEDRYTYTDGTTAAGVVVYGDKFAYSHHGTDPASGKLCNSFDLVRVHLFGHLTDKQGFAAMEAKACADKGVRRVLAEENRARAAEDFDLPAPEEEEDDSWMSGLEVDRRGRYLSTVQNINLVFSSDPRLKGAFALNRFNSKPCVLRSLPWRVVPNPEPLRNVDFAGLRNYIETAYGIAATAKIEDALMLELERNSFHPIRNYLDSLRWDGVERIDTLLIEYFGAEDNVYTREAIRKMLAGAVARVKDPGVKFDLLLTLVGAQGCGKSTFVKKLGCSWFSDSFSTVQGKEAYEQIQGAWIVEMAELSGLRRAEVESVKHFISKQEDSFRPAYGRVVETYPRQCVFFGTTNSASFLNDPSGNRRFMPIDVVASRATRSVFDLTDSEIGQIWAEACKLYAEGETLYLSREAEAIATHEQREHSETDERRGLVEAYLERTLPENWADMDLFERRSYLDNPQSLGTVRRTHACVAEIWCECLGKSREDMDRYKTREINDMLRSLVGWEQCRSTKNFRLYGKQKFYVRK